MNNYKHKRWFTDNSLTSETPTPYERVQMKIRPIPGSDKYSDPANKPQKPALMSLAAYVEAKGYIAFDQAVRAKTIKVLFRAGKARVQVL